MAGKGFIGEFKEFIAKGNVMDMAVGVVIGGAFGAIVTSLVDDIIGPILGVIMGGVDFTKVGITVGGATIAIGIVASGCRTRSAGHAERRARHARPE